MGIWEILLIAVGLSMDAFAVAVAKGLSNRQRIGQTALICGLWFGAFQAIMPAVGFLLGSRFADHIAKFDHWIAFVLLAAIGVNMIRECRGEEDEGTKSGDLGARTMFLLAVATAIDALAVGVTFAFLQLKLVQSVLLIGCTTFVISAAGALLGVLVGKKLNRYAKAAGGVILIVIGLRILISHLLTGT